MLGALRHGLASLKPSPSSFQELQYAIHREYAFLPEKLLDNLMHSMGNHIKSLYFGRRWPHILLIFFSMDVVKNVRTPIFFYLALYHISCSLFFAETGHSAFWRYTRQDKIKITQVTSVCIPFPCIFPANVHYRRSSRCSKLYNLNFYNTKTPLLPL